MFGRRAILAILAMMLLFPLTLGGTAAAEEGTDPLSNFPPEPEGEWYVYDVADVISDETEAEWEASLRAAHEENGRLVRLVTISQMCDFDQRVEPGHMDLMCEMRWTFDECYQCGYADLAYGTDDSYAGRMFRAYGMDNTTEPSMLIGVSTQDRRFRYVMPDHTTAEQSFSGIEFEQHSWLLSNAADGYGSWEDALAPHVEFGLLVSEGKTTPYPSAVQFLLIGGVAMAALSIVLVLIRALEFKFGSIEARTRLALGAYRDMAVLIHARLTLDGNFGAMERYRRHIDFIERHMGDGPPDATFEEYEEKKLRQTLVEIEACFQEMGLHNSVLERQKVESAVAFEPLDHGEDVELIHTYLGGLSSTWKKVRAPAWVGIVLTGVFVAACFVQQDLALLSVSPYHFAVTGASLDEASVLLTGLIPVGIGLFLIRRLADVINEIELPARGATTVDFAALEWPTFGAMVAGGYAAALVGHDEHGSPIFETRRVHSNSNSGSGGCGGGGGGGCGGGGCGGGGCGGGGGF